MYKKIFYMTIFFSFYCYSSSQNNNNQKTHDNKNISQENNPIFFYSLPTKNQTRTNNILNITENTSNFDKDLFDTTATTLALISLELETSLLEKARKGSLVVNKNEKFSQELHDTLDNLLVKLDENNKKTCKAEDDLTAKRITENKKIIDDVNLILSNLPTISSTDDISLSLIIRNNTQSFTQKLNSLLSQLKHKKNIIDQEISDIETILNKLT